ncbi:MAG TPA: hypothetical protein DCE18_00900 [Syntrophobacteraceae bacterium]|nr:hypothetical protein [Syntrophobacteraceae bacterium]
MGGGDAGIAHQGHLGAVDDEAHTRAIRHGDHQSVEGNFVAQDLAKGAGEIERLQVIGRVIERGVAEDNHGDGLARQGAREVCQHLEDGDAPLLVGKAQGRGGQAPQVRHADHIPFLRKIAG